MARVRKHPDWKQKCYKFRVTQCDPPQELWDTAKEMRRVWNALCVSHELVRETITDATPQEDRKAAWVAFDVQMTVTIDSSTLNWECKDDIKDRFTKATVAAAKRAKKKQVAGWPRPYGLLRVSIPHRYTGGGVSPRAIFGSKAKRLSMTPISSDDPKRRVCRGVFGIGAASMPFSCVQHRVIGEDEVIKNVRFVGDFTRAFQWEFSIVIQVEHEAVTVENSNEARCAIDVGWRNMGDYYRVGMLFDGKNYEELICPKDYSTSSIRRNNARAAETDWMIPIPETHADVRDLQQLRDNRLNEVKQSLLELLPAKPVGFEKMGVRGLRKLASETDDDYVRALLTDFLAWDSPRHRIQTSAIQRMERSRTKYYELIAIGICRKYGSVSIESLDVKGMAEEADKPIALAKADRGRQIVAPASFLMILTTTAKRLGAAVTKKVAAYSTIRCECGRTTQATANLLIECECGSKIDQDKNAARNLFSQTWPLCE